MALSSCFYPLSHLYIEFPTNQSIRMNPPTLDHPQGSSQLGLTRWMLFSKAQVISLGFPYPLGIWCSPFRAKIKHGHVYSPCHRLWLGCAPTIHISWEGFQRRSFFENQVVSSLLCPAHGSQELLFQGKKQGSQCTVLFWVVEIASSLCQKNGLSLPVCSFSRACIDCLKILIVIACEIIILTTSF